MAIVAIKAYSENIVGFERSTKEIPISIVEELLDHTISSYYANLS